MADQASFDRRLANRLVQLGLLTRDDAHRHLRACSTSGADESAPTQPQLERHLVSSGILAADQARRIARDLEATAALPAHPMIGREIGGYRVVEFVGSGGMGELFRAYDPVLDKDFAIKVINPTVAANPAYLARLHQEARLASRIDDPNLVPILKLAEQDGLTYCVMPFVEGTNLAQHVGRRGRGLPLREALGIVEQAALGLAAIHRAGIVHRDVKPENLMIGVDGRVRVTDFGLARDLASDSSLTTTGQIMGTPYYMSPEQANGEAVDERTDIYSLGLTYFYLLTGRPPFEGNSALSVMDKQRRAPLPDPAADNVEATGDAIRLLRRMAAKDPAGRPRSMDEVIEAIERILADEQVAHRRRFAPGARALLGMGAGAFLTTFLLAAAFVGDGDPAPVEPPPPADGPGPEEPPRPTGTDRGEDPMAAAALEVETDLALALRDSNLDDFERRIEEARVRFADPDWDARLAAIRERLSDALADAIRKEIARRRREIAAPGAGPAASRAVIEWIDLTKGRFLRDLGSRAAGLQGDFATLRREATGQLGPPIRGDLRALAAMRNRIDEATVNELVEARQAIERVRAADLKTFFHEDLEPLSLAIEDRLQRLYVQAVEETFVLLQTGEPERALEHLSRSLAGVSKHEDSLLELKLLANSLWDARRRMWTALAEGDVASARQAFEDLRTSNLLPPLPRGTGQALATPTYPVETEQSPIDAVEDAQRRLIDLFEAKATSDAQSFHFRRTGIAERARWVIRRKDGALQWRVDNDYHSFDPVRDVSPAELLAIAGGDELTSTRIPALDPKAVPAQGRASMCLLALAAGDPTLAESLLPEGSDLEGRLRFWIRLRQPDSREWAQEPFPRVSAVAGANPANALKILHENLGSAADEARIEDGRATLAIGTKFDDDRDLDLLFRPSGVKEHRQVLQPGDGALLLQTDLPGKSRERVLPFKGVWLGDFRAELEVRLLGAAPSAAFGLVYYQSSDLAFEFDAGIIRKEDRPFEVMLQRFSDGQLLDLLQDRPVPIGKDHRIRIRIQCADDRHRGSIEDLDGDARIEFNEPARTDREGLIGLLWQGCSVRVESVRLEGTVLISSLEEPR